MKAPIYLGVAVLTLRMTFAAVSDYPPLTRIADLDRRMNEQPVHISGLVVESFRDEIDPRLSVLLVKDSNDILPVFVKDKGCDLSDLLDWNVEIRGKYLANPLGFRRFGGHVVSLYSTNGISAVSHVTDPLDAPPLGTIDLVSPDELRALGKRRVTGLVTAVWQENQFLVATDDGDIVRVELAKGRRAPACGKRVTAAGYPGSDIFNIGLGMASFREEPDPPTAWTNATPIRISASESIRLVNGQRITEGIYHGRLVTIRGILRSLPPAGTPGGRLILECEGFQIPVELGMTVGAADDIPLGCELDVTGVYIIELPGWSAHSAFLHIRGFMVVIRSADDIRIVRRPPWWTPARLLAVIGALVAALLGILFWNAFLRTLAERRGRELFRSQIGGAMLRLKIGERTRLAVELHDLIAQNLTGVSMEIETARDLGADAPAAMLRHVDFAAKALKSCRDELRNCLFDLRNQALEETDMNVAITRTLQPHLGNTRLDVCFNVPRQRFSDNTAQAILRAIRELVINAVRHGHATSIKITGDVEDDVFRCMVRDDGCGFDPADCPGVTQGHFGIQGVRERIEGLGGSFRICSARGQGTSAVITIRSIGAGERRNG